MTDLHRTLAEIARPLGPRKARPGPDEVRRVTLEIDVLVPVWVDKDADGYPSVTLAPASDWRIPPEVDALARRAVEDAINEEITEEWQRKAQELSELDRDSYDDYCDAIAADRRALARERDR